MPHWQNAKTQAFLISAGRIMKDDTGETFFLVTPDGKKCLVLETPPCNRPANILGLGQLMRLGFQLCETGACFASSMTYL